MSKLSANELYELTEEMETTIALSQKMMLSIRDDVRPFLDSVPEEDMWEDSLNSRPIVSTDATLRYMYEQMNDAYGHSEEIMELADANEPDVFEGIYENARITHNILGLVGAYNKDIQDKLSNESRDLSQIDVYDTTLAQMGEDVRTVTGAVAYKVDNMCEKIKGNELSESLDALSTEDSLEL